jgi:hypothetical protein
MAKKDMRSVKRQIKYDERYGYIDIKALSELLEEYENNRDKFTNFNSFLPRIADHFNQFATQKKELINHSRKNLNDYLRNPKFRNGFIIAMATYWIVFIIIRIRRRLKSKTYNKTV